VSKLALLKTAFKIKVALFSLSSKQIKLNTKSSLLKKIGLKAGVFFLGLSNVNFIKRLYDFI
jgi:hypothetical protein